MSLRGSPRVLGVARRRSYLLVQVRRRGPARRRPGRRARRRARAFGTVGGDRRAAVPRVPLPVRGDLAAAAGRRGRRRRRLALAPERGGRAAGGRATASSVDELAQPRLSRRGRPAARRRPGGTPPRGATTDAHDLLPGPVVPAVPDRDGRRAPAAQRPDRAHGRSSCSSTPATWRCWRSRARSATRRGTSSRSSSSPWPPPRRRWAWPSSSASSAAARPSTSTKPR